MKLVWFLLIGLGLSCITGGCQSKGAAEERSPGEVAFRSRCQTCHRLPKPTDKTNQEWRTWLAEHRYKAGMSQAEVDTVLNYLAGDSQS